MTLIVGFRGTGGVVLASDSQATLGAMKQTRPKLFRSGRLIWGFAGDLAASQVMFSELERVGTLEGASRDEIRTAISGAMLATSRQLDPADSSQRRRFDGLFAWHSRPEGRGYLLRAFSNGRAEFEPHYAAVGSSTQLFEFGFFGFSRAEFLDYKTLPLEAVKMLTLMVAEDAVRASAQGVCLPIQMAIASAAETAVLKPDDLKAVYDTVAAYRMHQADFLKRTDDPVAGRKAPGLSLRARDD